MKRNISDLLDAYGDPNIDLERGTPLSSERIKVLTMSRIKEEKKPRKRVAFRVMMAAAIIVTLVVSVFAASGGAEWFRSFFAGRSETELSAEQLAYIEQNAVAVGQSQTVDGYTVTLDACLSDGDRTYIKLAIQMADGIELPELGCSFVDTPTLSGGKADVASTQISPLELDHEARRAEILLILDSSAKQNDTVSEGEPMILELHGLREIGLNGKKLTDSTWRFELPLQDARAISLLDAPLDGIPATDPDGESCVITLTAATLRAMELEVTYEVADVLLYGSVHCDDIHVVMKDGTTVVLRQESAGEHMDTKTNVRWIEFVADTPIVLDEVAYIEFPGGVQIPVETEA